MLPFAELLGTRHPRARPRVAVPPVVVLAVPTSRLPGFQNSQLTGSLCSEARSENSDKPGESDMELSSLL